MVDLFKSTLQNYTSFDSLVNKISIHTYLVILLYIDFLTKTIDRLIGEQVFAIRLLGALVIRLKLNFIIKFKSYNCMDIYIYIYILIRVIRTKK